MQYIKDRIESFDDYFPCSKENCKLKYVQNWLTLFLVVVLAQIGYNVNYPHGLHFSA
jgi:hypothetical protein